MKTLRLAVIFALSAVGVLAILAGVWLAFDYYQNDFTAPIFVRGIWYNSKQVDILTDIAKTIIPTLTGFILIAGTATGYLHHNQYLVSRWVVVSIMATFILAVVSLALWVNMLAGLVNSAGVFDNSGQDWRPNLGPGDIVKFNAYFFRAVISAKLATISFFAAVDVAAIVGALLLGERQPNV